MPNIMLFYPDTKRVLLSDYAKTFQSKVMRANIESELTKIFLSTLGEKEKNLYNVPIYVEIKSTILTLSTDDRTGESIENIFEIGNDYNDPSVKEKLIHISTIYRDFERRKLASSVYSFNPFNNDYYPHFFVVNGAKLFKLLNSFRDIVVDKDKLENFFENEKLRNFILNDPVRGFKVKRVFFNTEFCIPTICRAKGFLKSKIKKCYKENPCFVIMVEAFRNRDHCGLEPQKITKHIFFYVKNGETNVLSETMKLHNN